MTQVKIAGYTNPAEKGEFAIYCSRLVYEFVKQMKPGDALLMSMDENEEFDFACMAGISKILDLSHKED